MSIKTLRLKESYIASLKKAIDETDLGIIIMSEKNVSNGQVDISIFCIESEYLFYLGIMTGFNISQDKIMKL